MSREQGEVSLTFESYYQGPPDEIGTVHKSGTVTPYPEPIAEWSYALAGQVMLWQFEGTARPETDLIVTAYLARHFQSHIVQGGYLAFWRSRKIMYPLPGTVEQLPGDATAGWRDLWTHAGPANLGPTSTLPPPELGEHEVWLGEHRDIQTRLEVQVQTPGLLRCHGQFDFSWVGRARRAIEPDVNGDGIAGGLDTAVVSSSANFGLTIEQADNPNADVNGDGMVNGLDTAAITNSATWGQPV